jgi:hypothetical protein
MRALISPDTTGVTIVWQLCTTEHRRHAAGTASLVRVALRHVLTAHLLGRGCRLDYID